MTLHAASLESERAPRPDAGFTPGTPYNPIDVRDARLVHQLCRAGYRTASLRDLLPTLRANHNWDGLLTDRKHNINQRAAALLQAATAPATLVRTPLCNRLTDHRWSIPGPRSPV